MDELRTGLELATDDELVTLTEILFRPGLNPMDHAMGLNPLAVQSQKRLHWLNDVEQRFRFLAADGVTVLRGETHHMGYRHAIVQVCRYLKIPYSQSWSTVDLESEVYLHVLERAWEKLPDYQRTVMTQNVQQSMKRLAPVHPVPSSLQRDPIRLMLKGSGAVMVSSVIRPWLLQQIARQFAIHAATYQATQQILTRGGAAIATHLQGRVASRMAQRGMAISAARYGLARGVFAAFGSVLWVWFFADLGWRAIATNYTRTIPVIFTLAQIRLLRDEPTLQSGLNSVLEPA